MQGLTDYLAVTGTMTFVGRPDTGRARPPCDGVIYESSRTRIADITDGTSTTVLVGERPPSPDLFYGWWTWGGLMKAPAVLAVLALPGFFDSVALLPSGDPR